MRKVCLIKTYVTSYLLIIAFSCKKKTSEKLNKNKLIVVILLYLRIPYFYLKFLSINTKMLLSKILV